MEKSCGKCAPEDHSQKYCDLFLFWFYWHFQKNYEYLGITLSDVYEVIDSEGAGQYKLIAVV